MIKLVAFDWNGTILADSNAMVKADNAVLKHFGLPKTTLMELQRTYTVPIKSYWIAMGFDSKIIFDKNSAKISSIFQANYEPLEKYCRTRSGARGILVWLKQNKIKSIIFSNHIKPHIEAQTKRLKIDDSFDEILARSLGDISHLHAKSKDQKLHEYYKSLKIKPREVLVVGDTIEEIEIAKKFRFFSVALSGGNTSIPRLKAAKPDFLIHNLNELKKIILKL